MITIIQDANIVRVVNSTFDNLGVAEILRADVCFTSQGYGEKVPCDQESLFLSSKQLENATKINDDTIGAESSSSEWQDVVTRPTFMLASMIISALTVIILLALCCVICLRGLVRICRGTQQTPYGMCQAKMLSGGPQYECGARHPGHSYGYAGYPLRNNGCEFGRGGKSAAYESFMRDVNYY